jgi:hypothetical protein
LGRGAGVPARLEAGVRAEVVGLRVAVAGELSAGQLGRAQAIYEQAFPPELRVPFAELARDGPADLLTVLVDGAEPAGVAALRLLDDAGWVFLRYFAIAAVRRRTGCGQRLWQLLRGPLAHAGWPTRIAFEVEPPAHAPGAGERQIRDARISFWRRCGCQLLPVTGYVMPPIGAHAEPEPMLLMASDPAVVGPLPADRILDLIRAIYLGRYQLGHGHPLVRAAVASLDPLPPASPS